MSLAARETQESGLCRPLHLGLSGKGSACQVGSQAVFSSVEKKKRGTGVGTRGLPPPTHTHLPELFGVLSVCVYFILF